jgi:hypothetical protein
MGDTRNSYKISVKTSEGKNSLEDLYVWEDNIKIEVVDCIHLAQDRFSGEVL